MNSALCQLTSEDLSQLAGALRSGRIAPPFSPLVLRRYLPESMAALVAIELQQRVAEGMESRHLADCLEMLCHDRGRRPVAEDLIDLVWTGPEVPGADNRDTGGVVRELFGTAEEELLLAGFAVYQGREVFKRLAERMSERPSLRVRFFLDVHRSPADTSQAEEILRRFVLRFQAHEWPGGRLPELYYDPRSLDLEAAKRSSLHAKCLVVDRRTAFVNSANFTEAAQTRNIEAGVLIRCQRFAARLIGHFDSLVEAELLRAFDCFKTGNKS